MSTNPSEPAGEDVHLHRVVPDDWESHRAIRLEMLLDAPDAFWFTHADEVGLTEAEWRAQIARAWLVQARDGEIVLGSAGLGSHWEPGRESTPTLFGMYVTTRARGRGVGERLVRAVLDEARLRGAGEVVLEVADTNAAAIALYERCGFVATGVRHPHPRRRELHELEMVCALGG
jgi:ribosomal protein S18 acetylase RimI-like enzyme